MTHPIFVVLSEAGGPPRSSLRSRSIPTILPADLGTPVHAEIRARGELAWVEVSDGMFTRW